MKRPGRVVLTGALVLFAAAFIAVTAVKFAYPYKYREEIETAAREYDLEPALVCGVIRTESRFRPDSVSPAGAVGLMQLMPATALFIAEREDMDDFDFSDLFEPEVNIRLGCAYLKYLEGRFDGRFDLALAAYNAGEGTVRAWLNNKAYSPDGRTLILIPYRETRDYAEKVNSSATVYRNFYGLI